MKNNRKRVIFSILFIFVLVVIHFVMGYGYIFKAMSYAYLRGQKGPGIKEHHLFENIELKAPKPIKWDNNFPNISISKKQNNMAVCSISGTHAKQPVFSPSGFIFEKSIIEKHLIENDTCPVSGAKLSQDQLIEVKVKFC